MTTTNSMTRQEFEAEMDRLTAIDGSNWTPEQRDDLWNAASQEHNARMGKVHQMKYIKMEVGV